MAILPIIYILSFNTTIWGKYQDYVDSIFGLFNNSNNLSNSSSLQIRINQANSVLGLFSKSDIIIGKGFQWDFLFYQKYGNTSDLHGFESIFFSTIVQNGLIGIILWISLFIYFLTKVNKSGIASNIKNDNQIVLNAFVISYFFFIAITGLCGSFVIFIIMYTILLKYNEIAFKI